nr:Cna B-type domain-containing protein [uncultured Peptostreptococcus sp.]
MNKTKKILPLFLLCLILSLIIFPSNSLAISEFDRNKDVEFTIDYKNEDKKLFNAEFDIYKVADVDKDLNLKVLNKFSKYPIDLTKLNQETWNDYALALKGHIQKDGLKAVVTGVTDANGIYKTKLKAGLYLVVGKQLTLDNYIYKSNPFLVLLPNVEKETGTWDYYVTSKPKTIKEEKVAKVVSKKVIKIWKDKGFENLRPKEVQIELLGNGKLKEIISLSEKNNWQYTWQKLDANVNWTVTEKVLDKGKYKVSISEEGNTFLVENTYISSKTLNKAKSPKNSLPQTGQLWWPVYTLVGIGSIMILLGFIQNRRKKVD